MTTYTNPRTAATFNDWPYGGTCTTATFTIEQHKTRGERTIRTTINPKTGKPCAPKMLTYSAKQRIVDGDDGKTYIATKSASGFVSIMRSDLQLQHEALFASDGERYAEVNKLFY